MSDVGRRYPDLEWRVWRDGRVVVYQQRVRDQDGRSWSVPQDPARAGDRLRRLLGGLVCSGVGVLICAVAAWLLLAGWWVTGVLAAVVGAVVILVFGFVTVVFAHVPRGVSVVIPEASAAAFIAEARAAKDDLGENPSRAAQLEQARRLWAIAKRLAD